VKDIKTALILFPVNFIIRFKMEKTMNQYYTHYVYVFFKVKSFKAFKGDSYEFI
jgi:hypothetical protein